MDYFKGDLWVRIGFKKNLLTTLFPWALRLEMGASGWTAKS